MRECTVCGGKVCEGCGLRLECDKELEKDWTYYGCNQ